MNKKVEALIFRTLLISSGILIGVNHYDLIVNSKNKFVEFIEPSPRYEPNIKVLENLVQYK